MKPSFFQHAPVRGLAKTIVLAGGCAIIPQAITVAGPVETESKSVEESEAAANWIEFSVGAVDVGGDDAAFQRRWGNNGDFYGGIDSFRFQQMMDDATFTVDGHALFGLEDYELEIDCIKDGIGFIRGGYREFRTWYDPSGGWAPGLATPAGWDDPISPDDDALELDRGSVWFEAGLRIEDLPSVTLGYEHRWRDGEKDSTIWSGSRGIYGDPAYYKIDETSDIFWVDVEHAVKDTDLALNLRYQTDENDDSRHLADGTEDARVVYESDMFSSSLSSQTRFNQRMLFSLGYMFTTLDTDIDGSFDDHDPVAGALTGGGQVSQHVANAGFWWNPTDDFIVSPSLRMEWQDINAEGSQPGAGADGFQDSGIEFFEATEMLEMRYTGIPDLLLHASAEWNQGDKDQAIFEEGRGTRWADVDTDKAKYTLGANYYIKTGLALSAQYYYRNLEQDFDNRYGPTGSTSNMLDGQLKNYSSDTHDVNLRLTWRAMPGLTFVTRYDCQQLTIENTAFWDNDAISPTRSIDSGEITRHILSESVTWNVTEPLYLRSSVHWVSSETDTPADSGVNGVDSRFVPDWDNDYLTASLSAGYALGRKTDLLFNYSYYNADNFLGGGGVATPIGTVSDEHALTIAMIRRINDNMLWTARYGCYRGDDDAAGGYNDYEAHMVSTGFRYQF
jgi:hypothetical protein